MTFLNISLPDAIQAWIDQQVAKGKYRTPSELICDIIRDAQKREAEERLESLLLEGINSGPATEMTSEDWDRLKQRARDRSSQRETE